MITYPPIKDIKEQNILKMRTFASKFIKMVNYTNDISQSNMRFGIKMLKIDRVILILFFGNTEKNQNLSIKLRITKTKIIY